MKAIKKRKTLLIHLKNAEHFDLHEEIIMYLNSKEWIPTEIRHLFNSYKACFENEILIKIYTQRT